MIHTITIDEQLNICESGGYTTKMAEKLCAFVLRKQAPPVAAFLLPVNECLTNKLNQFYTNPHYEAPKCVLMSKRTMKLLSAELGTRKVFEYRGIRVYVTKGLGNTIKVI